MKTSVKITLIVISAILICLACFACVISFMGYQVYADREKSHNKAEDYLNSEEYTFDRTMQGVRFTQVFYAIEVIMCSVSLITYVAYHKRLQKIVENPNYFARKVVGVKLLKKQMPFEVASIILLILLYVFLQFVQISFELTMLFMILPVVFVLPSVMFLSNILVVRHKDDSAPMLGTQHQPKL